MFLGIIWFVLLHFMHYLERLQAVVCMECQSTNPSEALPISNTKKDLMAAASKSYIFSTATSGPG